MNVPCCSNKCDKSGYVLTTTNTNMWAKHVVMPPTMPRTFCGYNSPIITHGTTKNPNVHVIVNVKMHKTGNHVAIGATGGSA